MSVCIQQIDKNACLLHANTQFQFFSGSKDRKNFTQKINIYAQAGRQAATFRNGSNLLNIHSFNSELLSIHPSINYVHYIRQTVFKFVTKVLKFSNNSCKKKNTQSRTIASEKFTWKVLSRHRCKQGYCLPLKRTWEVQGSRELRNIRSGRISKKKN